mmetsp:Transcript_12093/g.18195  ORF Transcript_12093/g.18195 Transcript_12093/m.18195 type:complete len:291 (-) Transcript_12093:118-990(-)
MNNTTTATPTTSTKPIPGTETREGYVIGPDGVEISEYEYQRILKVKRNNKRLRELGLEDDANNVHAKPSKDTTLNTKRKTKSRLEPTPPTRRSTRHIRKNIDSVTKDKQAGMIFLQNEDKKLAQAERNRMRKSNDNRIHQNLTIKTKKITYALRTLTEEQRTKFAQIPKEDWLDDMRHFLRDTLMNSPDNVRQTMDKITKLANGYGVEHRRSRKPGYVFQKGHNVNLGYDLQELLWEAKEWVDEHGGDPGNGWLIVHPVKKLWMYQVARFDNGGKRFMDGDDGISAHENK